MAVKTVAMPQPTFRSDVGSSPTQDNGLCDVLIIVLSLVVTLCPLMIVIKSFTYDIGEVAEDGIIKKLIFPSFMVLST